MDTAAQQLEASFEREIAWDASRLQFFNYATFAVSAMSVVALLTLVIGMDRYSIWLILLGVYATCSRLCVFVARYALRIPTFLLEGQSQDAAVREAAARTFDRHREPIARALLTLGNERPTAAQIAELSIEDAATRAREMDPRARRRVGVACLAVWSVVTVVTWGLVIATGGGPTELSTGQVFTATFR